MSSPIVVLNPHAWDGRAGQMLLPISKWLRKKHPGVPLFAAHSAEQALHQLRQIDAGSRVVLVGGDGTVHHMLPALLERNHELAVMPFGSGNDLAMALDVFDLSWRKALHLGLTGETRVMDIGWVKTIDVHRPFLSSVAAGFDAQVGEAAHAGPTWLRNLPRFLLASLRCFPQLHCTPVRLICDGALIFEGPTLLNSVLNTPSYGGGLKICPESRIDDQKLNLIAIGDFTRSSALFNLPRLILARHVGHPKVGMATFTELRIEAAEPLAIAADGESLPPAKEVDIAIQPGALRVVTDPN